MKRRRSKIDLIVRELAALAPIPFACAEFLRRFGLWVGKPVYVIGRSMPHGNHGTTLELTSSHYEIYYDKHDTPSQALLSILHELGHIALGHDLLTSDDLERPRTGCPHPLAHQREAEDFASALHTRIESVGNQSSIVLSRVAAILR